MKAFWVILVRIRVNRKICPGIYLIQSTGGTLNKRTGGLNTTHFPCVGTISTPTDPDVRAASFEFSPTSGHLPLVAFTGQRPPYGPDNGLPQCGAFGTATPLLVCCLRPKASAAPIFRGSGEDGG